MKLRCIPFSTTKKENKHLSSIKLLKFKIVLYAPLPNIAILQRSPSTNCQNLISFLAFKPSRKATFTFGTPAQECEIRKCFLT